jgi:hypothetical protein
VAEEEKLKLGKGAAFVKSRLKRLSQRDETWEADFEALPKPMTQTETHYLGMVVAKKGGALLADLSVHGDRWTATPVVPNSSICGGIINGGNSFLTWRRSGSGSRYSPDRISPALSRHTMSTSGWSRRHAGLG